MLGQELVEVLLRVERSQVDSRVLSIGVVVFFRINSALLPVRLAKCCNLMRLQARLAFIRCRMPPWGREKPNAVVGTEANCATAEAVVGNGRGEVEFVWSMLAVVRVVVVLVCRFVCTHAAILARLVVRRGHFPVGGHSARLSPRECPPLRTLAPFVGPNHSLVLGGCAS